MGTSTMISIYENAEYLLYFVIGVSIIYLFRLLLKNKLKTGSRVTWHKLIENSFFISYTDEKFVTHNLNINVCCKQETFTINGKPNNIVINLPKSYDFNKFKSNFKYQKFDDKYITAFIKGLYDFRAFEEIIPGDEELKTYKDFKSHFSNFICKCN